MNLTIKTTNMSLTPAIADYLEKKLKMIRGVDLEAGNVHLHAELGKTSQHHKSGDYFKAEIKASIGGHNIFAVSETDDLYAAIDLAKDTLAHEIHKTFEKRNSMFRRGARRIKNMLRFGRRGKNMQ